MRLAALGLMFALAATPVAAHLRGASQERPTFRTAVERVGVTAVVRKSNGQPVLNLKQSDFQLLDNGQPREILEFRSEPTPATVALLVDLSGSMDVAENRTAARAVAEQILAQLTPGEDEVGLFAFDTGLREVAPIGPAPGSILEGLGRLRPFGATSLYDAIAETGRRLVAQGRRHHAVVALTDGLENSSRLTAAEVSRFASEIDVPVYIVVVASPRFREGLTAADDRKRYEEIAAGPLGNLARWTGGDVFLVAGPAQNNLAARQILNELRHQYFIGFAPDPSRPGWHPIDLRTRHKDLVVRSRSGYMAGTPGWSNSNHSHH